MKFCADIHDALRESINILIFFFFNLLPSAGENLLIQ